MGQTFISLGNTITQKMSTGNGKNTDLHVSNAWEKNDSVNLVQCICKHLFSSHINHIHFPVWITDFLLKHNQQSRKHWGFNPTQ